MNDKTERRPSKGFSWVEVILLLGHLAIIAGLGISALAERPQAVRTGAPGLSILDSLRADRAANPQ